MCGVHCGDEIAWRMTFRRNCATVALGSRPEPQSPAVSIVGIETPIWLLFWVRASDLAHFAHQEWPT